MIPNEANAAVGVKAPSVTKVTSWATTIPAFFSPMKAINSPKPPEMAKRRFLGIHFTICSRMFRAVNMIKMIPSTNTAAKAASHE